MRLATIRTAGGTRAARIDGDHAVLLDAVDVGALLDDPGWRRTAAAATGPRLAAAGLDLAPVVPRPRKIFCVGLNYRSHIEEMGRDVPAHPTLFAKFARALVGAHDDIRLPRVSDAVDWEAELAVVVGAPVRDATAKEAAAAVAGYSVLNDVTARDWQNRTLQWLQGKTFEATTPLGPYVVTTDEAGEDAEVTCRVNDEVVQRARTSDLVFGPAELVAYVSRILTLEPGDVIATGTPGGVGHGATPPRYLDDGDVLTTAIEGIGLCRNVCLRA